MGLLRLEAGSVHIVRSRAFLLLRLSVVSALAIVSGCGISLDDARSDGGRITGGGSTASATVAGGDPEPCQALVVALAIPTDHHILDVEVNVDGVAATVVTAIGENYEDLLTEAMGDCDAFDPAIHDLVFASFALPGSCDDVQPAIVSFDFAFSLFDAADNPQDLDRLILGGTLKTDLENAAKTGDPLPLDRFECLDEQVEVVTVSPGGPIPTLSTWGLTVLTLVLLSGARVYGFRRHLQSAA